MKLKNACLKNFRRLENIDLDFEASETIFVGPNNSGKTSIVAAFRSFLENRTFKIHDFSVGSIADFDELNVDDAEAKLPTIELDLWFSIDPASIAFGRAFSLLPNLSDEFDEVGMRCTLCVKDPMKLWQEYSATFPVDEGGVRKKSLGHFLGLERNLANNFHVTYASLERNGDEVKALPLEATEGKRILKSLIRVDFIDAQRNIDDEEIGRSNKLSSAFASFYRHNLDQPEINEEAVQVIDENNDRLTEHYEKHFSGLITVIKGLGVPTVHDRELRLVSALSSEIVLEGSTDLLYVDAGLGHELPEAYNGLGFKHLIYMAVRISHYHLQWMNTEKDRPLCQVIFIEEPEAHLHAQVQQTFISNMWNILKTAASEEDSLVPQLAVTTHSSHILDAVEFGKVRYFQRCKSEAKEADDTVILNASQVHNLRKFQPEPVEIEGEEIDPAEALKFLVKYLRLTHCDLFFADAAILIEGAAEKLLLPKMIEKHAPALSSKYISVLEVGGAYSHRFAGLLEFLHIPYLVLTDIDSVDPANNRRACRADQDGAVTSNASLVKFFGMSRIGELVAIDPAIRSQADNSRFVSFQMPVSIKYEDDEMELHGRTLEETFIYENLTLVKSSKLQLDITLPENPGEVFEEVFNRVKSSSFKKTEFALDIISSSVDWNVPKYICDGLNWLIGRLGDVDGQIDSLGGGQ
ncbi:ATP-dependent nuclease [Sneathiella sp.]|uniref:ATP-dependent nuclease n=1 Tax=Sneathiella sp. TaxID=1964365 RepID=UPI0039E65F6A